MDGVTSFVHTVVGMVAVATIVSALCQLVYVGMVDVDTVQVYALAVCCVVVTTGAVTLDVAGTVTSLSVIKVETVLIVLEVGRDIGTVPPVPHIVEHALCVTNE